MSTATKLQPQVTQTALDGSPEARATAAENARVRNIPESNKPARPQRKFRVSYPGWDDFTTMADDAAHAWALTCDNKQLWPSPKRGTVIEIK